MKRNKEHVYYIDREIKSVGVYLSEIKKFTPEQPDKDKMTDDEATTSVEK